MTITEVNRKIGNQITKAIVYVSAALLLGKCVVQFFITMMELL